MAKQGAEGARAGDAPAPQHNVLTLFITFSRSSGFWKTGIPAGARCAAEVITDDLRGGEATARLQLVDDLPAVHDGHEEIEEHDAESGPRWPSGCRAPRAR